MIKTAYTFNYGQIAALERLPKGTKKKRGIEYADVVTAFDIESTNIPSIKQAAMYIWQFQFRSQTIIGRTWDDFRFFYQKVNARLPEGLRLVVYVHNLSYEFQFLKDVIPVVNVFAMDDRKVLKFESGFFEFRCSYLHSNMSLDRYLQSMGVPNKKIKGFDYSKQRFAWTRLSKKELAYCINDVKGLVQAIEKEMLLDGDNLYSIPLTSTGYVRREAKKAIGGFKKFIKPMLPGWTVFQYLRAAFRGGNTHANRWNANRLLTAKDGLPIMSFDISSSYPSVLLTEKFPGEFIEYDPAEFEMLLRHGKALLFKIWLFDVRLKNDLWGCPYLSRAKCESISGGVFDNGRVLECSSCFTIITEIDFEILLSEYDFDYKIERVFGANKRMLPQSFRDWLLGLYQKKTLLKGGDPYTYGKVKNKFNSAYG